MLLRRDVRRMKQSSGWIFHPLDDPYRLFFNNDAGSSGIADFTPKFFWGEYALDCLAFSVLTAPFFGCLFFCFCKFQKREDS